MPPGLHLFLMTVSMFLGPAIGVVAGVVFVVLLYRGQGEPSFEALATGFAAGCFGMFFLMRFLFTRVILAKCPKCGAGAKFIGGHPIQYVCKSCGHTHSTGVSAGRPARY